MKILYKIVIWVQTLSFIMGVVLGATCLLQDMRIKSISKNYTYSECGGLFSSIIYKGIEKDNHKILIDGFLGGDYVYVSKDSKIDKSVKAGSSEVLLFNGKKSVNTGSSVAIFYNDTVYDSDLQSDVYTDAYIVKDNTLSCFVLCIFALAICSIASMIRLIHYIIVRIKRKRLENSKS